VLQNSPICRFRDTPTSSPDSLHQVLFLVYWPLFLGVAPFFPETSDNPSSSLIAIWSDQYLLSPFWKFQHLVQPVSGPVFFGSILFLSLKLYVQKHSQRRWRIKRSLKKECLRYGLISFCWGLIWLMSFQFLLIQLGERRFSSQV